MPVRQHLGALGERQFQLLYAGQVVSVLGDGLLGVTLAFAVLGISDSASDLGLVLAAKSVPLVAFLLVGGVLADRLPRRAVLLGSDLVRAGVQALLAVLLLTGRAEIWHLVVLQAVYGLATAAFYPAWTALMPAVVSPANLQSANGWYAMTRAAGMVAGPVIAGVLLVTVGPGWAIAIDAGTFAVSAFFLALMRVPRRVPAPRRSFLVELREGWTEFVRRTWVWATVAASCVASGLFSIYSVLGPLVSARELGGPGPWAAMVAAAGAGAVVGGAVALRLRVERPLLVGSVTCLAFSFGPLALAAGIPVPLLVVASFLAGVGLLIFNTLYETMLQRHIPADRLGRVTSYDWFGSLAAAPLGYALAAPLANLVGVSAALWIVGLGALTVLGSIIANPSVRSLRAFPASVDLAGSDSHGTLPAGSVREP